MFVQSCTPLPRQWVSKTAVSNSSSRARPQSSRRAPWWRCFGALSPGAHSSGSSRPTAARARWQPRLRASRASSPAPSAWRFTTNPSASAAADTRKVSVCCNDVWGATCRCSGLCCGSTSPGSDCWLRSSRSWFRQLTQVQQVLDRRGGETLLQLQLKMKLHQISFTFLYYKNC